MTLFGRSLHTSDFLRLPHVVRSFQHLLIALNGVHLALLLLLRNSFFLSNAGNLVVELLYFQSHSEFKKSFTLNLYLIFSWNFGPLFAQVPLGVQKKSKGLHIDRCNHQSQVKNKKFSLTISTFNIIWTGVLATEVISTYLLFLKYLILLNIMEITPRLLFHIPDIQQDNSNLLFIFVFILPDFVLPLHVLITYQEYALKIYIQTSCTAKRKTCSTACITVLPKRLHMQTCAVWMAAWLEHAACQLQAVEQVFLKPVITQLLQSLRVECRASPVPQGRQLELKKKVKNNLVCCFHFRDIDSKAFSHLQVRPRALPLDASGFWKHQIYEKIKRCKENTSNFLDELEVLPVIGQRRSRRMALVLSTRLAQLAEKDGKKPIDELSSYQTVKAKRAKILLGLDKLNKKKKTSQKGMSRVTTAHIRLLLYYYKMILRIIKIKKTCEWKTIWPIILFLFQIGVALVLKLFPATLTVSLHYAALHNLKNSYQINFKINSGPLCYNNQLKLTHNEHTTNQFVIEKTAALRIEPDTKKLTGPCICVWKYRMERKKKSLLSELVG
ncbi:hypothetical protein VP01_1840g1 [Puccinia sorghi]|uniref:Uncharacterized protein n=1 Tax=Puccinia sorghi TaxID=27349 RepID=A0A0L6VDS6_9BASI|nr:hypothetical protein VP01_1840g1 [Puccinia sorghi]